LGTERRSGLCKKAKAFSGGRTLPGQPGSWFPHEIGKRDSIRGSLTGGNDGGKTGVEGKLVRLKKK